VSLSRKNAARAFDPLFAVKSEKRFVSLEKNMVLSAQKYEEICFFEKKIFMSD
jgi:hypothetical protein